MLLGSRAKEEIELIFNEASKKRCLIEGKKSFKSVCCMGSEKNIQFSFKKVLQSKKGLFII